MKQIIEKVSQTNAENNRGRYYVNDIPYCSQCRQPLAIERVFLGKLRKLPVICDCTKKELDDFEEQKKKKEHEEFINSIRNIGIPDDEYRKHRFSGDDMRMPKITNILKKYMMSWDYVYTQNHGIILQGEPGTGKTFYAACLANALADRGVNVLLTGVSRLISKMRQNYEEEKDEVLERISRVPLLILDDFGVERTSEYVNEKIYEIIDTRYRSGRPLFITTNQRTQDWFSERDIRLQRIYSRIREMCSICPPYFEAVDRRHENYEKKRAEVRERLAE